MALRICDQVVKHSDAKNRVITQTEHTATVKQRKVPLEAVFQVDTVSNICNCERSGHKLFLATIQFKTIQQQSTSRVLVVTN